MLKEPGFNEGDTRHLGVSYGHRSSFGQSGGCPVEKVFARSVAVEGLRETRAFSGMFQG